MRIRDRLGDDIAAVADLAPAPLGRMHISWTAAVETAACPLRYRSRGEQGWAFPGWSPQLAGGTTGRAALAEHLRAHQGAHPPTPGQDHMPLPEPVGAVRAWLRETAAGRIRTPVGDWIVEQSRAHNRAVLAATAAAASRWLGGFVRVLGWPLPDGLGIVTDDADNPVGLRWTKRYRIDGAGGSGVTIGSSPDAVLGRLSPTGDHTLVVHRPTTPDDTQLRDRAAFEAVAATLTTGVVPAAVVVTGGDTGEKLQVPIDDQLLDHGIRLTVDVVRQQILARLPPGHEDGTEPAARPSPDCHHCDNLDRCTPGLAWMQGPGRWWGGLPATRPDQAPDQAPSLPTGP